MVEQSLITSDHDFRNGMLVNYYKRYLERPDYIRYMDGPALRRGIRPREGSVIRSGVVNFASFRPQENSLSDVTDIYGNNYQLMTIYRYSDLSGWNWLLYHNLNRPPVTPHSPRCSRTP